MEYGIVNAVTFVKEKKLLFPQDKAMWHKAIRKIVKLANLGQGVLLTTLNLHTQLIITIL